MRFSRRHGSDGKLDPSSVRLPIIALVDVMLFLLIYFIFSGALEAQEAELATAIRAEARAGRGRESLDAQVLEVVLAGGEPEYRIGAHRLRDRDALVGVLRALPLHQGVVLRVADEVTVESAATAAQAAKDAGFSKVSYLPLKQ